MSVEIKDVAAVNEMKHCPRSLLDQDPLAHLYFGWCDANGKAIQRQIRSEPIDDVGKPTAPSVDERLYLTKDVTKERVSSPSAYAAASKRMPPTSPESSDSEPELKSRLPPTPVSHSGSGQQHNMYLQAGWLDGVGIYRGSTAKSTELVAWETETQVLAFDHLPLRATVQIVL